MAQEQPLPPAKCHRAEGTLARDLCSWWSSFYQAPEALQGPAPLWAGFPSPNLQASLLYLGAKVSGDQSMAAGQGRGAGFSPDLGSGKCPTPDLGPKQKPAFSPPTQASGRPAPKEGGPRGLPAAPSRSLGSSPGTMTLGGQRPRPPFLLAPQAISPPSGASRPGRGGRRVTERLGRDSGHPSVLQGPLCARLLPQHLPPSALPHRPVKNVDGATTWRSQKRGPRPPGGVRVATEARPGKRGLGLRG